MKKQKIQLIESMVSKLLTEQDSSKIFKRIAATKKQMIQLGLDIESEYPDKSNQVTQFINNAVRALTGIETEIKKG